MARRRALVTAEDYMRLPSLVRVDPGSHRAHGRYRRRPSALAAAGSVGQPPVIGEVVGGILLGPSALGWLWPEATAFLLPPTVEPFLSVIANLGVMLNLRASSGAP